MRVLHHEKISIETLSKAHNSLLCERHREECLPFSCRLLYHPVLDSVRDDKGKGTQPSSKTDVCSRVFSYVKASFVQQ